MALPPPASGADRASRCCLRIPKEGNTKMDIKGHAAIVTGGGSGLGAATAAELAKAGAKVALLDVNMDAANAHAKDIGGVGIKCGGSGSARGEGAVQEGHGNHRVARRLVNSLG